MALIDKRTTPAERETEVRRPRIRPYPYVELPRLLRQQQAMAQVLWRHLGPILDTVWASTPQGWAELEAVLGAGLQIQAKDPFLAPMLRAHDWVRGGLLVALEAVSSHRKALLAIDQSLLAELALDEPELIDVLRKAFFGAFVRVLGTCAPEELPSLLGPNELTLVAVDIAMSSASGQGWGRLLTGISIRLDAQPPMRPLLGRLWPRRLRVTNAAVDVRVEAGYGRLSALDLSVLDRGDLVILDRFGPRPVTGGAVWLRVGGGRFLAHLDGDGLRVSSPFEPDGETLMSDDSQLGESDGDLVTSREHLLRELMVQVTCEIGRITMNGREVLELRPGAVLPFGRPLAGPVDLTVGGRIIARGELVDVEGEIGVRLTDVFDS